MASGMGGDAGALAVRGFELRSASPPVRGGCRRRPAVCLPVSALGSWLAAVRSVSAWLPRPGSSGNVLLWRQAGALLLAKIIS